MVFRSVIPGHFWPPGELISSAVTHFFTPPKLKANYFRNSFGTDGTCFGNVPSKQHSMKLALMVNDSALLFARQDD